MMVELSILGAWAFQAWWNSGILYMGAGAGDNDIETWHGK